MYPRSVGDEPKPVQLADAIGDEHARQTEGLVGAWWRHVPRVLWRPREVFVALRETDEDDQTARQEPILAIVLLAGIAAVLMMGGTIVSDPSVDGLVVGAVTFISGALYGAAAYVVLGIGVLLGVRGAEGEGTFRDARHLVAFSLAPLAASVIVLIPVIAVAYGSAYFGDETPGSSTRVVLAIGLPFVAWSAVLLGLGLRVTYQLSWRGVVAALALAGVFVAAFVALPAVL
jgi:Yip1-like protein